MAQYSQALILEWSIAAAEAQAGRASEIEPAHLLLGLCKLADLDLDDFFAAQPAVDPAIRGEVSAETAQLREFFQGAGWDPTSFRRRLRPIVARPGPGASPGEVMHRSRESRHAFRRAEEIASTETLSSVRPLHLLQAVLEIPEPPWAALLAEMRIEDPLSQRAEEEAASKPSARRTPYLDRLGRDLTQLARDGKLNPVIGRRKEILSLARVLTQRYKRNALVLGEAGVGKTCIVEGLAQWLIQPGAPSALKDKRVVEVPIAGLVAGTKHRGDFEERMEAVIREATEGGDVILFIDEVHTMLVAGGGGGSLGASDILKPALARGDLCCIGATTISEYRKCIEVDPALERRFRQVWVDEPTRQEAVEILMGVRSRLEEHHGVSITEEAVEAAVGLSMRYVTERRLPDKAIDAIDEACASSRLTTLSGEDCQDGVSIGREDIAAVVSRWTDVPLERLTRDDKERLLHMEEALGKRVMGQDEAVSAVSKPVRAARAGLKNPKKPIGVFLFVGATGTGKTELAKALAEFLFDDEDRLIQIDMSEYMEKHNVSRLLGAPPGYVGHEEEGQLTGPVRTHPYSVVLFDEVEKAHPDVLNIFLQMFAEGRLTDAHGRRVSFTETVIILTSNLGVRAEGPARPIGLQLGEAAAKGARTDQSAYRQQIMDAVRGALRPELLNRIRNTVLFYPLSEPVIRRIIDKFISHLRLWLQDRKVDVELTEPAYELLMKEGFDTQFGARAMERTIQALIEEPLSMALLEGRFAEGTTVSVDARDGEMILEAAERTPTGDLGG